jgi:hypothetical protein
VILSVPADKYRDSFSIMPRPFPSKSFLFHQFYHSTLRSVGNKINVKCPTDSHGRTVRIAWPKFYFCFINTANGTSYSPSGLGAGRYARDSISICCYVYRCVTLV